MSKVHIVPTETLGFGFVPGSPDMLRPLPFGTQAADWRLLSPGEISLLEKAGNQADAWTNVLVSEKFDPRFIRDCRFYGLCRIGAQRGACLEHHDLRLPIGIYKSTIIASDIAADVAIHNVAYLSRMQIEERCLLFNIQELVTTNHAKFGNGVLMDGENEAVRIWLEIGNENGGRRVLPFEDMLPADAWIWSKFRDDTELMASFVTMTEKFCSSRLGTYGIVGTGTVLKNSRILKDVRIGSSTYIKGINKLKNLTIHSSSEQPTQIGEGCELVNGIIGYGCRVFYGVKAVRFILNDHSTLKYGARLINSILGPNSTISCCEVLNSLLFGAHEQHHNSSFLCAGVLKGMSNVASAATIGSNHNSRAPDGEIVAERGFWPGLSVSLKHNSRFAAFCLLAKGSYPAELDIPLPFSLVSNEKTHNELLLMPGYWFRHNMYALARNAAKTADRDLRCPPCQSLDYDWLAPDTVDQMIHGRQVLEQWGGTAFLQSGDDASIIASEPYSVESSKRVVRILHPRRAWNDYGRMIRFYAVRTLLVKGGRQALETAFSRRKNTSIENKWENVGGQMMRRSTLENLKTAIRNRQINTWAEVHRHYDIIAKSYDHETAVYAEEVLTQVTSQRTSLEHLLTEALETANIIFDGIRSSRLKDYTHPFRNMLYDSDAERDAVLGNIESNAFINRSKKERDRFLDLLQKADAHTN